MTAGTVTPEEFESTLGFNLDAFQRKAMESVASGRSVLVAAPTGSGKTVVAQYAIALAASSGSKAFYTTPLKALSNQKYGDLSDLFGLSEVGLLTGDTSVNGGAPIVVMTTEVLRNMVYEGSAALGGLRFVILDEVHYLQNPYRGGVWEEVIVHTPADVSLICLSATVSNVEEFGEWLTTVRGATDVVIEEHRPVALENLYMASERRTGRIRLLPTFVNGRPNPEGPVLDGPGTASVSVRGSRVDWRRYPPGKGRTATPRRIDVADHLHAHSMLPAIYFVFSRDGCDRAAASCLDAGVRLTTGAERAAIREIAESKVEVLSDGDLDLLGYGQWLACLEAGVAAHHAGLVPPFKEAVEACFATGAVKLVFATETLSLGINMPARSVVIEKLTKFTGETHEHVTPGEYTQLTGRAGRRGLDNVGYGVVLWSPSEPFEAVASLASARSYELRSSFRPTYNMAANLVRSTSREEAHHLLNLSFAQFRADAEVVRLEAEMTRAAGGSSFARRLARRIDTHANSLSRTFDVVIDVLSGEGYLLGWSLTESGSRLARIYHESDLLVSESLEAGLLDGLNAAELAAVASQFTYEARSSYRTNSGGLRRSAPGAKSGSTYRKNSSGLGGRGVAERCGGTAEVAAHIALVEDEAGLPRMRPPDTGFAMMAWRWASGYDLGGAVGDAGMPAGDFVRNVKQLVDLVRQLSEVAPDPGTRRSAGEAVGAMWRGVVAASNAVGLPTDAARGSPARADV